MSPCPLLTLLSSTGALSSWLGSGPDPWLSWRRSCALRSRACGTGWPRPTPGDTDDAGSDTPKLTSQEKKELAELRRDKHTLEMEVEILKRAAAYFARENVLPN
jgi:hypothetical protein